MLLLPDPDTGDLTPLATRAPGLLVLSVDGGLRACLAADVLRRTAQLHSHRVAVLPGDRPAPDALERYNISLPATGLSVDATADVHVTEQPDPADPAPRKLRVPPGPDLRPADPLVVRLALLTRPLTVTGPDPDPDLDPDLDSDLADEARLTHLAGVLDGCRAAVADWAEHPSAPLVPATREAVLTAAAYGLDARRVLELLHELGNDPDISPGAKFETFAWADRLVGLDLARDVGRTPNP